MSSLEDLLYYIKPCKPGSELSLKERVKDNLEEFSIEHPGVANGILASIELSVALALMIHAWWNIDYMNTSGTPTPTPWEYTVWPIEYWLMLTAGLTTSAMIASYDGSYRIGKAIGDMSVHKKKLKLKEGVYSDLEHYLMVENGFLVEKLKPYRKPNRFLNKSGWLGLKISAAANAFIWGTVIMHHFFGRNGGFGLDMAQWWNTAAYGVLLPAMGVMMGGRFYRGTEMTDVMGLPANYNFDDSVLEELIILKGIYACQNKYGEDISLLRIKRFLNDEFLCMNLYPKNKNDKLLRIQDEPCRNYAIDYILGKVTKKRIIKCVNSLNHDFSYTSNKYIKKIKTNSKKTLKLTDDGWELLYIFDSFGATGKNGAGFARYMDKKQNSEYFTTKPEYPVISIE